MQESQNGEPGTPKHHFFHGLYIHHTEDEYELVENEVPKLVLQILKSEKKN